MSKAKIDEIYELDEKYNSITDGFNKCNLINDLIKTNLERNIIQEFYFSKPISSFEIGDLLKDIIK